MKTFDNRGISFKVSLLALTLGVFATSYAVSAQDALLEDAESVFNSDQIDIDGEYARPRKTAAQRIEKMRKKLEQQNEDMVSKKIEDIRIREEQKLAKKLKKAFNGGNVNTFDDEVRTSSAAVIKTSPIILPEVESRDNKVTPKFGLVNYSGERADIESELSLGVSVETDVHPRWSVGVGVQYSTLDMKIENSDYNYSYYYYNGDKEEQMSFSHLNVDLYSKFFFTVDSKIRPFIGAGVGYNRTSLEYDNNNDYNDRYSHYNYYYGYENYKVEEVNSSYVSGSLMAGAEMSFSGTVGAALEFKYATAFNSDDDSLSRNDRQRQLENYSNDLQESDQFSVNAGLMIKF